MNSKFVYVIVIIVIFAVVAGLYSWPDFSSQKPTGTKSIVDYFPENLRLFAKFNLENETLKKFSKLQLLKEIQRSPFREAYLNRIAPLLELSLSQFRVNTPYPSKQILRYVRDSVAYLFKERNHSPVFVVGLSDVFGEGKQERFRSAIEEWVLSPARERSNWSVRSETINGVKIWTLQRSGLKVKTDILLSFSIHDDHLLAGYGPTGIKQSIQRYGQASNRERFTFVTNKSDNQENLMKFYYFDSSDTLEIDDSPATEDTFSHSSKLNGAIISRGSIWEIRTNFPRLSEENVSKNTKIEIRDDLNYLPDNTFFVLQSPPEYLREGSPLLGKVPVPDLHRSRKHSKITADPLFDQLWPQLNQITVSFSKDQENKNPSHNANLQPLLVLDVQSKDRFQENLVANSSNSRLAYDDTEKTLSIPGTDQIYFTDWNGNDFLIAEKKQILDRAINRIQESTSDISGRFKYFPKLNSSLNDYDSLLFLASAPLAHRISVFPASKENNYAMLKLLFGFDPNNTFQDIVRDLPGTLITSKRNSDDTRRLRIFTGGDIFPPLMLKRDQNLPPAIDNILPDENNLKGLGRDFLPGSAR